MLTWGQVVNSQSSLLGGRSRLVGFGYRDAVGMVFAEALHHFIPRGNGRQRVVRDERDRQRRLDWLARTVEEQGWRLHVFVLMSNHEHLLFVETPEANLLQGMKLLKGLIGWRGSRRSGHRCAAVTAGVCGGGVHGAAAAGRYRRGEVALARVYRVGKANSSPAGSYANILYDLHLAARVPL